MILIWQTSLCWQWHDVMQWAGDDEGPDWGDLKHNEKEPELVLKKVKDVSSFSLTYSHLKIHSLRNSFTHRPCTILYFGYCPQKKSADLTLEPLKSVFGSSGKAVGNCKLFRWVPGILWKLEENFRGKVYQNEMNFFSAFPTQDVFHSIFQEYFATNSELILCKNNITIRPRSFLKDFRGGRQERLRTGPARAVLPNQIFPGLPLSPPY